MLEGCAVPHEAARMKPELLHDASIQQSLATLPTWHVEGRELVTECRFASYLAGIEFIQQVGALAEAMNHHPDLFIGWRKVTVKLTTHSAGGLTRLDFELARQIKAKLAPETDIQA